MPNFRKPQILRKSIINKEEISFLDRLTVFGLFTFALIFLILSDLPKSTISPYIYIYIYMYIYEDH